MLRNKPAILLLVGSVISGVIAVYIAEDYIKSRLENSTINSSEPVSTVKIVVAKIDMIKNDVLTYENLSVRDLPIKYAHENVIVPEAVERLIGNKLILDIKKGEPLLLSFIKNDVSHDISQLIKSGERAVTIQVDSVSSMSGLLRPGNRVDLMLTLDTKDRTTRSVIKNATVLATGDSLEDSDNGSTQIFNTITLAVTPVNASRITLARSLGTLSVVLRSDNVDNNIEDENDAVSAYTLFGRRIRNKNYIDVIVGGQ